MKHVTLLSDPQTIHRSFEACELANFDLISLG